MLPWRARVRLQQGRGPEQDFYPDSPRMGTLRLCLARCAVGRRPRSVPIGWQRRDPMGTVAQSSCRRGVCRSAQAQRRCIERIGEVATRKVSVGTEGDDLGRFARRGGCGRSRGW